MQRTDSFLARASGANPFAAYGRAQGCGLTLYVLASNSDRRPGGPEQRETHGFLLQTFSEHKMNK